MIINSTVVDSSKLKVIASYMGGIIAGVISLQDSPRSYFSGNKSISLMY